MLLGQHRTERNERRVVLESGESENGAELGDLKTEVA
jgi:hypothetical protein